MNDETNLIKTLARESEKISSKETFLLPKINQQTRDLDVTGWNENKSVVSSFFHISVLKNRLRPSQNFNELWKTKLNRSPESILQHQKSNSLPFTRTTVYKISNLSLDEAIKEELLRQSVNRRPKLPFLHKNALISVYLPPKRIKKNVAKKILS